MAGATKGAHEVAPAPTAEQIQEALAATDEGLEARAVALWHCTAHPKGHGHHVGFDYVDAHQDCDFRLIETARRGDSSRFSLVDASPDYDDGDAACRACVEGCRRCIEDCRRLAA